MKIKQLFRRAIELIKRHPWRAGLSVLGTALFIVVGVSQIPRTIAFSYSGQSCVSKLTLFPQLQQSTGEAYQLSVEGVTSIGDVEVFGTRICASPTIVPDEGVQHARVSIGGTLFPASYIRIVTPEAPSVALHNVQKPIAAAKPLSLPLSHKDTTFTYVLSSGGHSTDCDSVGEGITCPVASLSLAQGEAQELRLARHFDEAEVDAVFSKTVDVLPAVAVVDSSVKEGQKVYTKNQPFTIIVDKKLDSARATLVRHDGDTAVEQKVSVTTDETAVTVVPVGEEELPRASDYTLTLTDVEAHDGSALTGPHAIRFALSGGPKVASVSVGATGIDPNARIALKLDQARKGDQNIAELVKIQGAPATVTATGDTIYVSLAGAARCADISIVVSKELLSEHDVKAGEDWGFKGRTRCHTVETIGYSEKGRAITAYVYGNGSTTYLYTGGIHGSEQSSVKIMRSWMDELESNPKKIPANARVIVIPSVNPDGVATGSRNNSKGVNLNRNFATSNWASDTIVSGGRTEQGTGGASAGSEAETRVLAAYTARVAPRLIITYHSLGSLVNSNDAGVSISAGRQYASLARYRFIPNSATTATFGFEMTGTYEDWALERGMAAILIELNTHTGNHFTQNRSAMWAMLGY